MHDPLYMTIVFEFGTLFIRHSSPVEEAVYLRASSVQL